MLSDEYEHPKAFSGARGQVGLLLPSSAMAGSPIYLPPFYIPPGQFFRSEVHGANLESENKETKARITLWKKPTIGDTSLTCYDPRFWNLWHIVKTYCPGEANRLNLVERVIRKLRLDQHVKDRFIIRPPYLFKIHTTPGGRERIYIEEAQGATVETRPVDVSKYRPKQHKRAEYLIAIATLLLTFCFVHSAAGGGGGVDSPVYRYSEVRAFLEALEWLLSRRRGVEASVEVGTVALPSVPRVVRAREALPAATPALGGVQTRVMRAGSPVQPDDLLSTTQPPNTGNPTRAHQQKRLSKTHTHKSALRSAATRSSLKLLPVCLSPPAPLARARPLSTMAGGGGGPPLGPRPSSI
ncbi:hypothetical protein AAG570_000968 [Ranatra chinensis]|uniref:Uncharacterized protein n=1 Tax=Ranatra chinensis TaxID=642074 RepID=A0ABD0YCD2_9HEMI